MLCKPTQAHMQALSTLSRLPEWMEVNRLLQAELDETAEQLFTAADDAATRKLQGRAKLLRELQNLVATAPDVLAKMRGQK